MGAGGGAYDICGGIWVGVAEALCKCSGPNLSPALGGGGSGAAVGGSGTALGCGGGGAPEVCAGAGLNGYVDCCGGGYAGAAVVAGGAYVDIADADVGGGGLAAGAGAGGATAPVVVGGAYGFLACEGATAAGAVLGVTPDALVALIGLAVCTVTGMMAASRWQALSCTELEASLSRRVKLSFDVNKTVAFRLF